MYYNIKVRLFTRKNFERNGVAGVWESKRIITPVVHLQRRQM